ncbi:MAG: hypothetical protein KIT14_00155 [bacterium]|nr:hypothetical protein [bacterium]
MRRAVRWMNALGLVATLASALAVLGSWVLDPTYRQHYGDQPLFVLGYVALHAWYLRAYLTDARALPAIAFARAAAGLFFLVTFTYIGPAWMVVSPARYVYLLFEWGSAFKIGMFAFVFLGRGAFNVFSAFVLTETWWRPMRETRPLLARLVTGVPVLLIVGCLWLFLQLARMDARTFSPEAHGVAAEVLATIDCETLRQRRGTTTTDVRQRGERRYEVTVRWDCRDVQVMVRDPDGKLGTEHGPRFDCCPNTSG